MDSSIYKDELDKIKFSFSTLHTYETCPFAFYLKKIEKEDGVSNGHADIGKYGHELLEQIFSFKTTPQEALDRCIAEFEDRVSDDISENTVQKKFLAICEYLADLDIDEFHNKYEVLGVEKIFNWNIDGHKMIGFADLILKRKSDGKVILVDHKSAGHFMKKDGVTPLKSQEESLEAYTKQMYLYADAMHKTMGYYPDLIVWNHFLDGGKKSVIEFSIDSLSAAVQWAKDIIEEIYHDEYFVDNQSYMMCNVLCSYRDICEYRMGEDE